MKKKRTGAVFLALLICGLAAQAPARGQEPKVNSNSEDPTKIRGLLEEFRQDIIRKDGYALTKFVLFHHSGLEVWQVCEIDGQWKILSVA